MDLKVEYTGESSGYKGALLDNEVSPRIVECVNACAGIEDPAAFMESVRERANAAFAALTAFVTDHDDDFSTVARDASIDNAREFLSALIGSLPLRP